LYKYSEIPSKLILFNLMNPNITYTLYGFRLYYKFINTPQKSLDRLLFCANVCTQDC